MNKQYSLYIFTLFFLFHINVYANDSQGFALAYEAFFGSESSRIDQKNCGGLNSQDQGVLGSVNSLFCKMEKDWGIRGTTSGITKSVGFFVYKIQVDQAVGSAKFSGYDSELKMWVCKKTKLKKCDTPAQFQKAIYFTFTFSSDGSVSKGSLLKDPLAMKGQNGGALHIQYDIGTSSTNKTITSTYIKGTQRMTTLGTNSNGIIKAGINMINGTNSSRFAGVHELGSVKSSAYFTNTISSNTLTSDIISFSTANCFSRKRQGRSHVYSLATGCVNSPVLMPSISINALGLLTALDVLSSGGWLNMTAQPAF